MDEIDYKILRELQFNARVTNTELAERVALSPSPCWNRVTRLETDGIIEQLRDHHQSVRRRNAGLGVCRAQAQPAR